MSMGFAMPSGRIENPALQKAESEWKAENAISCPMVIERVPWIVRKTRTAPMASTAIVNPRI